MEEHPARLTLVERRRVSWPPADGLGPSAEAAEAFWHASFGIPIDLPSNTVALRRIGLGDDAVSFYECGCEIGPGGCRYCSTHIAPLQAGAPLWEIDLLAYAYRR